MAESKSNAPALAEYDRWSTGSNTARPAGERDWVCRQNDNGSWQITTYHEHYHAADRARHEQALAAALNAAPARGLGPEAGYPAGDVLKRVVRAMESVTVFITSRERIKRPEGEDWWQEEIAFARAALASGEPNDR